MSLGYEVQGSGPTILMVHGLGGSSNCFQPQAHSLAKHYRVVRPDLPGAGRSANESASTISAVVDALLELADTFEATHWIGHSLGTVICQLAACRAESRIKSMTLLGPIAELADPARAALKERAARIRAEGLDWFVDGYIVNALSKITLEKNPLAASFLRESLQRQSAVQYADFCSELASFSSIRLESLNAPTLLLTGDEDKVATVAAVREMARRMPRATVRVVENCGHWPTIEHPARVTAEIEAHLTAVESTGTP